MDAQLFVALRAVLGAALVVARLVGTRRQRRLVSDSTPILGAVRLWTLEAKAATERLQAEAERVAD